MFHLVEAFETHPRRHWPALVGFTAQFAVLSAMLVIPLLYPHGLPEAFARRRVFLPVASGQPRPIVHEAARLGQGLRMDRLVVVSRPFTFNPHSSQNITGESLAPPSDSQLLANGDGVPYPVMDNVVRALPPKPAPAPVFRRSVMMEGNLLRRVAPEYPTIAKQLGVQGSVLIKAVISRAGTIEQTEVVSGQPWLSSAALSAVRQWKYRPYYLNGEPVEVETQITVNFVLHR